MRNILLVLSYDGRDFSGFQLQRGRNSVQGKIQESLRELTGEEVKLIASGRTDAGVHASCQVVNFRTSSLHPPETFLKALNSRLPSSIRVFHSREVSPDFNARKRAIRKLYRYAIYNGMILPPFLKGYVWHLSNPILNPNFLRKLARQLEGEHDFRSFMGSGSSVVNTVRRIEGTGVSRIKDFVIISVVGNGFLKNMVRNIVGTMIDICSGRIKVEHIREIIQAKDRKKAGKCAPGEGLYLLGVDYPEFSFRGNLPFFLDL